jgi:ABC-type branched-subunit amino acid transport system substrate-binding protein
MINRKEFFLTSLGVAAAGAASAGLGEAADLPALGTFPRGTQGDSVFVGVVCDLTGPYAEDGADQQRGYELAFEQLNDNTGVFAKLSSLGKKKGLLGKRVAYRIADSQTKPAPAIAQCTGYITHDQAILITGGISSEVALALEKLGQDKKVLYLCGASGSNDITGKGCQRYGFRAQPSAYMAARALAPVLDKNLGNRRRAAYLVPDYNYGYSVFDSMKSFTERIGWKTAGEVLCPLGTRDYAPFLRKLAATNADVFINATFGGDAIASTKQAAQLGLSHAMRLVVPNISPFMADGVGAEAMAGVYGTLAWYWRLEQMFPLSRVFVDDFQAKFKALPRWTAYIAYLQMLIWADAVARAKTFYPPAVIGALESETLVDTPTGLVYYNPDDHQLVCPVPVVVGNAPHAMTNRDDYFSIVEVVDGRDLTEPSKESGCVLPSAT